MDIAKELLEEQLYIGHVENNCSYLSDRRSRLLFLDGSHVSGIYRLLLDKGYRRYGRDVYRPDCGSCQECQILRIPVSNFKPTRSQKRVWRVAQKIFRYEVGQPSFTNERLELYRNYLEFQHEANILDKKEMITPTAYKEFFVDSFLEKETFELQLFYENTLIGLGIIDKVSNVLSAVYFMFHPSYNKYSLGTYAILLGIHLAHKWGLHYYYPGYYIENCSAMNYKANFYPNEIKKINDTTFSNFRA